MSIILLCMSMLGIMVYSISHDLNGYVDLQIKFNKDSNKLHFILNCSSIIAPFGRSAEFLVNDITRANIRSSNGVCYNSRRICHDYECSCTSEIYVWSFWSTPDAEKLLNFTCQLRFEQGSQKSHVLVYETKIYNGSDIFDENTNFQHIPISMSDLPQGYNFTLPAKDSGDFPIVYISIIICVPVAIAIVALSILCLKCFNKRKQKMYAFDLGQILYHKANCEQEGHIKAREDNLYTDITKSNENGNEETTYICHSIRNVSPLPKHAEKQLQTNQKDNMYTNFDEMGFEDKGMPCHRISEETANQEGAIKTREEENLYTNMTLSNESGTEEKTYIFHNIRKASSLLEHAEEQLQTKQEDNVYTNLDEIGFGDKGMQCQGIAEEPNMNEVNEGRPLSHEESAGGNTIQTHSQTAFYKQEIHPKSVRDQYNTDHLTKSLNLKESSTIEGNLQARHTNSESTLDNMRRGQLYYEYEDEEAKQR